MPRRAGVALSVFGSLTATFIARSPWRQRPAQCAAGNKWPTDCRRELLHQTLREALGQHVLRIIMPMRVVGREQQDIVGADMLQHALQHCGFRRSVVRLQGETDMPAHQGRGRFGRPRHLAPHAAPGLVRSPQEARQPGEARFDHHHLELGNFWNTPSEMRLSSALWNTWAWPT